jgi:hypothetical protein
VRCPTLRNRRTNPVSRHPRGRELLRRVVAPPRLRHHESDLVRLAHPRSSNAAPDGELRCRSGRSIRTGNPGPIAGGAVREHPDLRDVRVFRRWGFLCVVRAARGRRGSGRSPGARRRRLSGTVPNQRTRFTYSSTLGRTPCRMGAADGDVFTSNLEGCKETRRIDRITSRTAAAWRARVGLEGIVVGSGLLGICLYETSGPARTTSLRSAQ